MNSWLGAYLVVQNIQRFSGFKMMQNGMEISYAGHEDFIFTEGKIQCFAQFIIVMLFLMINEMIYL